MGNAYADGNSIIATQATQGQSQGGKRFMTGFTIKRHSGTQHYVFEDGQTETITVRDSNNPVENTRSTGFGSGPQSEDNLDITLGLCNRLSTQRTQLSVHIQFERLSDRVTFRQRLRPIYLLPKTWEYTSNGFQSGGRDGWNVASRVVSADGTAASEKVWTYSYTLTTRMATILPMHHSWIDYANNIRSHRRQDGSFFRTMGRESSTVMQTSTERS